VLCVGLPPLAASASPRAAASHHLARTAIDHSSAKKAVNGDIDDDGVADPVIGERGRLDISYSTATFGPDRIHTQQIPLSLPAMSLAAGDFNGDGFADLAVGNDYAHSTAKDPFGVGEVWVWYGSTKGLVGSPVAISGTDQQYDFGKQLAAGDVNGDGRSDLLVPFNEGGGVVVLLGAAGGLSRHKIQVLSARSGEGLAVGDLNHDGRADLALGCSECGAALYNDDNEQDGAEGTISVYLGASKGLATKPTTIAGKQLGLGYSGLGSALTIGRVNGDAYGDLLAATDRLTILFGSKTGVTASHHSSVRTPVGSAMAVGDVDGDGFGDVVMGEPEECGCVYVVRGTATGLSSTGVWKLSESSPGVPTPPTPVPAGYLSDDEFGETVATFLPAGSSYASIAVGAPGFPSSSGLSGAGRIDVFPGSSDGPATSRILERIGTTEDQNVGLSLAP
jgi:hypothetical protein